MSSLSYNIFKTANLFHILTFITLQHHMLVFKMYW